MSSTKRTRTETDKQNDYKTALEVLRRSLLRGRAEDSVELEGDVEDLLSHLDKIEEYLDGEVEGSDSEEDDDDDEDDDDYWVLSMPNK